MLHWVSGSLSTKIQIPIFSPPLPLTLLPTPFLNMISSSTHIWTTALCVAVIGCHASPEKKFYTAMSSCSIPSGKFLCMGSATERRHYNVTLCLICWDHMQSDPCFLRELIRDSNTHYTEIWSLLVTQLDVSSNTVWKRWVPWPSLGIFCSLKLQSR